MFQFLKTWFGGSEPVDTRSSEEIASRDRAPVATASVMGRSGGLKATAGSWETEEARRESDEFWSKLRHSDSTIAESLKAIPEIRVWLDGTGSDAEPKAFVRLALLLVKNGESLIDQPGISLFLDGRWTAGPGPNPQTDKALALLAQSLKMPIKLYFTKAPGAPMWMNEYKP